MNTIAKYLISFYQKFISVFSYGSCRYYPTCSEYAKWQFENNSFFKALYSTITRIISCNQYFEGGFDYPKVDCRKIKKKISFKKINVKYWYIPTDKKNCIIIKKWDNK
jgi:putative membrane protein insertion efficiency factor